MHEKDNYLKTAESFPSWWQSKTRAAGSDVGTCRLVLFTIYIYVSENVIPEVQPLYK